MGWALTRPELTEPASEPTPSIVIEAEASPRFGAELQRLTATRRSLARLELRMTQSLDNGSPPSLGVEHRADALQYRENPSVRKVDLIPARGDIGAMASTSFIYRGAVGLTRAVLPILANADPKLKRGHEGRIGATDRLTRWAAANRDLSRPLVWFHASSVGEGLQAEAVLRRIRARHPDWQIAYTYFSPSAEGFASRAGADVADYLPYDLPAAVERVLGSLRPDALVFSKLDLWPELASRADQHGVRVGLIAGTVRPTSRRLETPIRQLLLPGYAAVRAAGAVSEADATRLARLGVSQERIAVIGDPRFDSAIDRVRGVAADDPLLRFGAGAPTMVAGSTWPGDEEVLLTAFSRLHVRRPDARLILVPHEPSEEHLRGVEARASMFGLPAPVRLSQASGPVPILLVDRVGVLATMYGAGTMAAVGGGFHGAGLHSVLEPAAWERPVVFGPRWTESRDAALLLQAGGAEAIAELGTAEAAETLSKLWEDWMVNERRRSAQGRKALAVVQSGTGAAERTANLVESLVLEGRLLARP
jgi:3-deoxy-D-manno-octulosonic-acid transferase